MEQPPFHVHKLLWLDKYNELKYRFAAVKLV